MWTKDEIYKLKTLRSQGLSFNEIQKRIEGKDKRQCEYKFNNLGREKKLNVNTDFFYKNNEVSNYILGYWLADGCIMNKSGGYYFSMVSNDMDILMRIKEEMNIKTKIYNNSNNALELRVGNKKLVENMLDLGCEYRKTHTIEFDSFDIKDEFFYDFLRGYFDGDGNLVKGITKMDGTKSVINAKFTGCENIIKSLDKILKSKGFNSRIYKDNREGKNNCWYLSFPSKEGRKILNLMYNGSKIHLNRKKDEFLKYVITD